MKNSMFVLHARRGRGRSTACVSLSKRGSRFAAKRSSGGSSSLETSFRGGSKRSKVSRRIQKEGLNSHVPVGIDMNMHIVESFIEYVTGQLGREAGDEDGDEMRPVEDC